MSKPKYLPKRVMIVSSILVVLWGLVGLVLPVAQADVIVPLVRDAPSDEAYSLVARNLSQGMRNYYSVLIVLGVVNLVASWIDLRNHKKNLAVA